MNSDDAVPLKKVIDQLIEAYRLKPRLTQLKVEQCWGKVAGKMISRHTTGIRMKNKSLIISLDSPALRTELSFAKSKLIRALNKQLGEEAIEDILFY